MSHERAPVDSIPQTTQHALLTAAFHYDANLLNLKPFCVVSKSAAGRSYDTEVLLFVDLTIDRS
ncbi:UNVERIFIED_CONTAM: hypothetical protein NCL1_22152 [Trichonephila clavipes]